MDPTAELSGGLQEGRTRPGEGGQTRGALPQKELAPRRLAHRRPWRRTQRSGPGFCILDISSEPVQGGRATQGRHCVITWVIEQAEST